MRTLPVVVLVLGLLLGFSAPTHAQPEPRFGAGVQLMGTTVDDNFGPGVRLRSSVPLTQDVSFGLGAGFTGYIFEGRDDASYGFDPQASLIVTLPGRNRQRLYVMGGAGAYVPFGNTAAESGPTIHLGLGKVWLLNESSFFFEFDPALFIGKEQTQAVMPIRLGVIF
ncbi:MAG: hypothetical protein BRD55_07770 [Bacteroidetes bacterium SW_9_63_38]|nr:MAG: hypothetical protein BRD55_07770 [Bacteroidetes bacterium SW_9_63_38]